MKNSQMLHGKNAIIFGAGGSIGSTVAKAFAAEGANVFLTGRTKQNIEKVAAEITNAGGKASTEVVDALDESAVSKYVDEVVAKTGTLDIVLNTTGPSIAEYDNGKLAIDLPLEKFMTPVSTILKSNFITSKAAVRHMSKQRSGVIIFITGSPARGHVPGATAIGAAFGAIETFMENLAFEVSPLGVRSLCLRITANVDTRTIQDSMLQIEKMMNASHEQTVQLMASMNWLKLPGRVDDTANEVVFLASDKARFITGTVVNASAGAAMD